MSKPRRFPCYLASLRKEWGLSQEELAALLPRGNRNRLRDVESGKAVPNAQEILAYSLLFGVVPHRIFPKYVEYLEDSVMRRSLALYERLEEARGPKAAKKLRLLEDLPKRAASNKGNRRGA